MDKCKAKTLPGFMELLPYDQILFDHMISKIKKSYEKFGFLPLDTPIIEYAEVLLAKAGGETEKQIYRFNKGDNDLALRFDLTVPLAKYISQYYNELSFPFKRYQIGKVYRGERPQKGRFREFYQCDIDIIGEGELSVINDAEIVNIIVYTFKELGFEDFTIYLNNRKILNGFFNYLNLIDSSIEIMRIIDKLDKIGIKNVQEELELLKIGSESINQILNLLVINGNVDEKIENLKKLNINDETFIKGLQELEKVVKCIRLLGINDKYFTVDLKIARGLDYYTGTVYETFLNNHREIGSICSGGRYDNLSENYSNKKFPGVGVAIGFTRLFSQLKELKLIESEKKSNTKVLVLSMDEEIDMCIRVGEELRKLGINTQNYYDSKNIKNKLKYANKLNIPYVIIIGENERQTGLLTLKNMETGQQENLKLQEIKEYIIKGM